MALKTVTIAGGGLAGLALGIGLRRRDVPVTVLEAGAYPRHRVCGEFLSGIQDGQLEELGIRDLLEPGCRPRGTRWFDGDHLLFEGALPEPARGLSRHFLDRALSGRLTQLGGRLETGGRFLGDPAAEGTVLATGRPLRPGTTRGWFGIKAHYRDLPCGADLEVHLGCGAYVGLAAVEDGWVNVTGLFREEARSRDGGNLLENALHRAGLGSLAGRLGRASFRPGSLKGVNRFELGWQPGHGHGIRIGDAAAMIAPVTGNGMSMALQGACLALDPLQCWSRGGCTWAAAAGRVAAEQRRMFGRRLACAALLQRFLMAGWTRRICGRAVRRGWVSFDTLYRLVR